MRKLLQSLSFRLALTYVFLFCLSVALIAGLFYWTTVIRPTDALKAQVEREGRVLSRLYLDGGREALKQALERRTAEPNERKAFHAFLDPQGMPVTANLPSWPRESSSRWIEIEADTYLEGDEIDHNSLVRDHRFPDGARLLIGRDAEDITARDEIIRTGALWVLSATLVLGVAVGLLMSRAIGHRIDTINLAARRIMDGEFSGRVPVRGSNDDFDRLGETLNLMLERIQESFEAVRRVSDNVSHELRTPLARLVARLERLEPENGDPSQRLMLQDLAIDEARRLQRIFDALLRIARIESGGREKDLRFTDVSLLLTDVAEYHAPEAARRTVQLISAIDPGLTAEADPDLLFQAVSNLLDNALKYVPEGGKVYVQARKTDSQIQIRISDNGPGLAADEIDRVTERFYRGANAKASPGEGLGLSVVAAIAKFHAADLRLVALNPGLAVEFTI